MKRKGRQGKDSAPIAHPTGAGLPQTNTGKLISTHKPCPIRTKSRLYNFLVQVYTNQKSHPFAQFPYLTKKGKRNQKKEEEKLTSLQSP